MYEEMIVTGAWWDYRRRHRRPAPVGDPAERRRADEARDARLEHRSRTCGSGAARSSASSRPRPATDLDLLYACIEPSLDSKEFFLRKAIGWALREYAWTDADEVRRYVARNAARLSGLSRREALKNVGAAA